jgi:hypothetical protein
VQRVTKPRKSLHYISDVRVLLRDAQPTWAETEGEMNSRIRQKNERAQQVATDELIKLYRQHAKRGALHNLDLGVRNFCEDLKARNGGRLPTPKGGRPHDEHRRLLIAIKVTETIEAIKASGGKRGTVERALHRVATDFCIGYRRVREIYYDRDPTWMRDLRVSLALRGRGLDTAEIAKKRRRPV